MIFRKTRIAVALLCTMALFVAAANASAAEADTQSKDLVPVTLTLNWYPYGEHAPFYYGVKQGIYKQYGIDLTIRAGHGSGKTVLAVGGDQTDFGWASTPALLGGVSNGVPAKSVGVFLQTAPASVEFFCKKGYKTPQDLKGATIASTAGDALSAVFPAFLEANGMTKSDVKVVNTSPAGKIATVISGMADALLGFAHDQGPVIEHKTGKDICYIRFADYGVNYYSNGLIASDETIANKPDLVQAMLSATSAAFTAATKHPKQAVAAMQGASAQLPAQEVLLHSWKEVMKLLHTERSQGMPPGANVKADWQHTIDVFAAAGKLDNPGAPSEYWASQFKPE